ncbi:exported hypothetical protein [Streptomyces misionensis JCM 4497]
MTIRSRRRRRRCGHRAAERRTHLMRHCSQPSSTCWSAAGAWRQLPPCFGISKSTAHLRFLIWSRAGVWGRLHEAVLHRLGDASLIDATRVVVDTAHLGALRRRFLWWTGSLCWYEESC